MLWMPDTNVWINLIKHPGGAEEAGLLRHTRSEICSCTIVLAELWHGARKYGRPDRRRKHLDRLLSGLRSFPFDEAAADEYADIRHQLEVTGQTIGGNDLLIAAVCRSQDVTLATANTREFTRVPGLKIENWSS